MSAMVVKRQPSETGKVQSALPLKADPKPRIARKCPLKSTDKVFTLCLSMTELTLSAYLLGSRLCAGWQVSWPLRIAAHRLCLFAPSEYGNEKQFRER